MKRCPACQRDYYDETLLYCLDDGARLLEGSASLDEPATAIFPSSDAAREGSTRAQTQSTDRSGVANEAKAKGFDKRLMLAPVALVIIIIGGYFGYRYLSPSAAKQIESIAVMPFVNESGNAEVEYLSDGMTETLISSLSQLPNLNVKPRSTVFRYKGKEANPQTIGKELNVQAVLNGRVVQRGQDISLFVELVDVALDRVVWSQQYNRKQTEIVALQSDIARDVSSRVKTKLTGADEAKVTRIYTQNPEAYQLYLKGNFYRTKYTEEGYKKGIEYYQKAIEIDPNYALAYQGIAAAYDFANDWYLAPPPAKLAHVVYMTRRFDEMISWYQNVFEAKVQHKNPAFAFLTYDDEHHRFAFANMNVLNPNGTDIDASSKIGVNHVGYTYSNVGKLLVTYDRLKGLSITPYWQVHHGVTLSLYYQDPDGNRMEFQVDCCGNAEEAHEYMNSNAFAANPVGVEVNFDSLLAQYRNGAALETLLLQPEGPPSPIPIAHGL